MIFKMAILLNLLSYALFHHVLDFKDYFSYLTLNFENYNTAYSSITSSFSHANILHIAMNMFFIFNFRKKIDFFYNYKEQFFIYFLSVFPISILNILYIVFVNNNIFLLGYSGVAFAVLGSVFMLFDQKDKKIFLIEVSLFHFFVIYYDLHVAWFAHLFGFIIGISFYFLRKKHKSQNFQILKDLKTKVLQEEREAKEAIQKEKEIYDQKIREQNIIDKDLDDKILKELSSISIEK